LKPYEDENNTFCTDDYYAFIMFKSTNTK